MAHIVIIGASTGGLPAAYDIRSVLDSSHKVTVISNTDTFQFVPSNPWVAVGWRTDKDTTFDLAPRLKKKNIEFIPVAAKEIKPDQNKVWLMDGRGIDYDYLVIATGPKLAFDEIEGLGPEGFTQSVCTVEHAKATYGKWTSFVEKPGPIVVGAVQGASCFGPAYEFAFILDCDLRKRKLRNKVPITFLTSEPYIGHLGLGGLGDSKWLLEHELRQHHTNWIPNAKVARVEDGKMFVEEYDSKGNVINEHELPFAYSVMIPAFKGVDAVAAAGEDMVNPRGFVKVNELQQNPT